jgi:hypothetical protein
LAICQCYTKYHLINFNFCEMILTVSKTVYERTYREQVESKYQDVPLLSKSPFNKIYETRAKFLENKAIYEIDKLVGLIEGTKTVPSGFVFFKTDMIQNAGVNSNLELKLYAKDNNKFYFELRFAKHTNKISLCIESDQIYIYNFLNNVNNFGEQGLGHTIMSFIKTLAVRIQTNIMLTFESQLSLNFYTKEQFDFVSPNGDELVWKWNREKLKQDLIQT